jgi:hypothetical protein
MLRAFLAACGLLLLAPLCLLQPAQALTLTWTWDAPDPAPPPGSSYRVYFSKDAGTSWLRFPCPEQGQDPALNARLCTLGATPPGPRCYTVRAVAPLGEESANSNVLCYPFGPTPAAGQLRERTP